MDSCRRGGTGGSTRGPASRTGGGTRNRGSATRTRASAAAAAIWQRHRGPVRVHGTSKGPRPPAAGPLCQGVTPDFVLDEPKILKFQNSNFQKYIRPFFDICGLRVHFSFNFKGVLRMKRVFCELLSVFVHFEQFSSFLGYINPTPR